MSGGYVYEGPKDAPKQMTLDQMNNLKLVIRVKSEEELKQKSTKKTAYKKFNSRKQLSKFQSDMLPEFVDLTDMSPGEMSNKSFNSDPLAITPTYPSSPASSASIPMMSPLSIPMMSPSSLSMLSPASGSVRITSPISITTSMPMVPSIPITTSVSFGSSFPSIPTVSIPKTLSVPLTSSVIQTTSSSTSATSVSGWSQVMAKSATKTAQNVQKPIFILPKPTQNQMPNTYVLTNYNLGNQSVTGLSNSFMPGQQKRGNNLQ